MVLLILLSLYIGSSGQYLKIDCSHRISYFYVLISCDQLFIKVDALLFMHYKQFRVAIKLEEKRKYVFGLSIGCRDFHVYHV